MIPIVLRILFLLALALVFAAPASARGGGGCVEEGTSVLTPSGPVPIERMKPGDAVLGIDQAAVRPVTVRSVMQVRPDEYIELTVHGRTLRVTPEHPVGTAPGVFRLASRLRKGDAVILHEGDKTVAAALSSLVRVRGGKPAYNLLVSPAGTYLANFNFLEWLGTVFLLLAWYSLFIHPTTLAILATGQWVNEMQLAGFIAADLAPLGVLYWSISKRRKAYQSRLPA